MDQDVALGADCDLLVLTLLVAVGAALLLAKRALWAAPEAGGLLLEPDTGHVKGAEARVTAKELALGDSFERVRSSSCTSSRNHRCNPTPDPDHPPLSFPRPL